MVIKTTLTREQRLAKLRELSQQVINSGVFNNPKLKDPEGVTVFCGEKYRRQPQPATATKSL